MAASLSLVTLVYRQSLHIGKTPSVWGKRSGRRHVRTCPPQMCCCVCCWSRSCLSDLLLLPTARALQAKKRSPNSSLLEMVLANLLSSGHYTGNTTWNYPTKIWLQQWLRSLGPSFVHPHQGPSIPCRCCCWPHPCQGYLVGPPLHYIQVYLFDWGYLTFQDSHTQAYILIYRFIEKA